MFDAGYTTGNTLDITYLLSKYLNLTISTDNIAIFIPEILKKYGSGKNVTIKGKFITEPSTIEWTKNGYDSDISLKVEIGV
jgi:hypothetical protein